jgi:hypothetical protein
MLFQAQNILYNIRYNAEHKTANAELLQYRSLLLLRCSLSWTAEGSQTPGTLFQDQLQSQACCNWSIDMKVSQLQSLLLGACCQAAAHEWTSSYDETRKAMRNMPWHVVEGDACKPLCSVYTGGNDVQCLLNTQHPVSMPALAELATSGLRYNPTHVNSSSAIRPHALLHCRNWHWVQYGGQLAAHT